MKLSTSVNTSSLKPGIRRGRADFGEQLDLVGTGRRRRPPGYAGQARRACPAGRFPGRARRSSIASSAARASRYSKRLPGTIMPLTGSSSRWLARPIRCSRRELPLGAPIWTTRSMSPQSMPRSRLAVATSAAQLACRHRRLDLAARLQREAAVMYADRQRLVVDGPQVLENQLGEAARVAEDQGGLVPLDQLHHFACSVAARMARPGDSFRPGSGSTGLALRQAPPRPASPDPCRRRARASCDRRRDRRRLH